jgi:hypothetical protein
MTFDIKGSHHSQKTHFSDQWWLKKAQFEGHKKVMKCRNFTEINEDYNKTLINISADKTSKLQEIIIKDSKFLQSFGLMDYSLLFAIE